MPEIDLSDLPAFESRLRAALVVEAARVDVPAELPARVRARVRRRRGSRRLATAAFVAAVVVVAAVAVAIPHGGRPASTPTSPSWPRVGTLRPQPGGPVEDLADAGDGVLYGAVRHGGVTVAARSLDGGTTWTVTGGAPCGRGAVGALAFSDPMHGIAACPSSYVVTADGGASWATATGLGEPADDGPLSADQAGAVVAGHGSIWALSWRCTTTAGDRGRNCQQYVASSTDGGASFATSSLPLGSLGVANGYSPGNMAFVQITGPQRGYVLAFANRVPIALYATTDGWRTWTTSAAPCGSSTGPWSGNFDLLAASPSVVYLWCTTATDTGLDLALYRSTDGGHGWDLRSTSFPPAFTNGQSAQLPIPSVFAAAGPSTLFLQAGGALVRSTDAGATWHVVPGGFSATFVHFTDAAHGVLLDESPTAGARFGWWTTDDAGATWQSAAESAAAAAARQAAQKAEAAAAGATSST